MTLDPFSDWDAAYVLGALSMDQRREFERHFATCSSCANSVTELAGIPGILSKIDTEAAVALIRDPQDLPSSQHEPDLLQKLARAVGKRRVRSRRRLQISMAAAAAVFILFGVLGGTALHSPNVGGGSSAISPSSIEIKMAPIAPIVMTADLRVTKKPWGTRFDWSCSYVGTWSARYSPNSYDLVITDTSGQKFTIATWRAPGPKAEGLAATTNLPVANIKSVEIRATGTTAPLVRGEI
jgi:anti-sigma factor RsiW